MYHLVILGYPQFWATNWARSHKLEWDIFWVNIRLWSSDYQTIRINVQVLASSSSITNRWFWGMTSLQKTCEFRWVNFAMDLLLLLTSGFMAAAAQPIEYIGSNYTTITVTTERYSCSGPLTGGNDATKIHRYTLGDHRCSYKDAYFECSVTGSKVGYFSCSNLTNDTLIEEYSNGACYRCDEYMFPCVQIWFKGKRYDGKYFKPVCNSLYSNSVQSIGQTRWTLALAGAILLGGISGWFAAHLFVPCASQIRFQRKTILPVSMQRPLNLVRFFKSFEDH